MPSEPISSDAISARGSTLIDTSAQTVPESSGARPLSVIFDISVLGAGVVSNLSRTGIFRLAENALAGFAARTDLNLEVFASPQFIEPAKNYIKGSASTPILRVFSIEGMARLWGRRPAIYHSPFYAIPEEINANERITKFLTVCDLIPVKFPHFFEKPSIEQFHKILSTITPETRILCISQSTKIDLCNHLPHVVPENVSVTHLAASSLFHPVDDRQLIEVVRRKYGIPDGPYLLSVCTLEPRKNIDAAVGAFLNLLRQERIDGLSLVLVGSAGWKINSLLEKYSRDIALKERLVVTGYVHDEDLAPLYSGAAAFVYPSFYEGFGLPPLEAMKCGVPVITSNNSSLPEVVGNAGILVAADDRDALSQAILDIVSSDSMSGEMRKNSIEQAAKFSWESHVEETVTAYRRAMAQVPSFGSLHNKRKLKIGLNFTGLIPGKIGGMEKYMRALVHFIPRLSDSHSLYVFLRPEFFEEVKESPNVARVRIDQVPMPEDVESQIHTAVEELGIDVWFSPLLILDPLTLNIPSLYCVPDLQHEYYPEFFSVDVMDWRNRFFRRSAEKADGILTISNYSKQTIIEKYGVSEDKIFVTWLDCPTYFTSERAIEHERQVREKYDLPKQFIFYPANTWEHKNHLTLLRALECYGALYGEPPALVLTGYESDAHGTVARAIADSKLSDQVKFLGYVPKNFMPAIYRNATCLVFPSMFEGFGIPLVEAMRTDCPIIAANNTTMKEIAGDAALYFNTMDEIELAVLVKFVVESQALREFLIDNGRRRAKLFSFEKCVCQTLDVIDQVYWDFHGTRGGSIRARQINA